MIVTIRWNAVSTEVRINVKYHRGINQCHIASDKIIEVRSNGMEVRCNGMKVRSNGMEVRSNGMEVRSNGMKVRSNGRKVRSNGTRIRSNGMQVAIRLNFCPECPSIAVRLFSNRSQMTSTCGKNKKVAHEAQSSVSLMFLPHFDVLCDLLLNRRTATWNLFVLYNKKIEIYGKKIFLFQILPL